MVCSICMGKSGFPSSQSEMSTGMPLKSDFQLGKLEEPHQTQPQDPRWLLHTSTFSECCSNLLFISTSLLLFYLFLIKSVVHKVQFNLYLWICCYRVCLNKILCNSLLSTSISLQHYNLHNKSIHSRYVLEMLCSCMSVVCPDPEGRTLSNTKLSGYNPWLLSENLLTGLVYRWYILLPLFGYA